MDKGYIKETVGNDLVKGFAAILERKPADPIQFLGEYLVAVGKSRENGKETEIQKLAETTTIKA